MSRKGLLRVGAIERLHTRPTVAQGVVSLGARTASGDLLPLDQRCLLVFEQSLSDPVAAPICPHIADMTKPRKNANTKPTTPKANLMTSFTTTEGFVTSHRLTFGYPATAGQLGRARLTARTSSL